MNNYEDIYSIASTIEAPTKPGHLKVEWLLTDRLAIGRDADNRHILVLAGSEIQASDENVKRALKHDTWSSESDPSIEGTLLRLHAGEEFMVATTTIAVELLRRGLRDRPAADVFPEVEGFIELVIRRVLLPHEALLGLLGELVVFDLLLDAIKLIPETRQPDPGSLWQGYSRKSRDFRLNRLGLEVKTTGRPTSHHHIGSLDQVEPRMLDGEQLEALSLVSIGLSVDDSAETRFSVAKLTDSILSKLDADIRDKFLDQLRQYGPDECIGYDHSSMSEWEPYARGLVMTFPPRVYDMADPNLGVIRREGLQRHFPHVDPSGISFVVDLPEEVPGSHGANPRTGLPTEFARLVASHT